jgi:putative heme transporter
VSRRRVIALVIALIVIVGVFAFVLPRIADYRAVWQVIRGLGWAEALELGIAVLFNIATFGPAYMATLPGLGYWRATLVAQASTASTYIAPGGAAVGVGVAFAMLRGWGFTPSAVTLAVTLTGVWSQLFTLAAPAVAFALLTFAGGTNTALRTLATVGLVIFVLATGAFVAALASDRPAGWLGDTAARVVDRVLRIFRRGPVTWNGESLVRFRSQAIGLLRRRWPWLTLATLAGQLTVFGVLVACLRTVGVGPGQVTLTEAFAAWTFVRLLGSVPITPGGIGVVELGLTGALTGFGGSNDAVVAAVLLYRVLTIVPTLVLGLTAGALWRRLRPELSSGSPLPPGQEP